MESKAADPEPEAVARELLAGPKGAPNEGRRQFEDGHEADGSGAEEGEARGGVANRCQPKDVPRFRCRTAYSECATPSPRKRRLQRVSPSRPPAAARVSGGFGGLNQRSRRRSSVKTQSRENRAEGAKEAKHYAAHERGVRKEDERKKKQKGGGLKVPDVVHRLTPSSRGRKLKSFTLPGAAASSVASLAPRRLHANARPSVRTRRPRRPAAGCRSVVCLSSATIAASVRPRRRFIPKTPVQPGYVRVGALAVLAPIFISVPPASRATRSPQQNTHAPRCRRHGGDDEVAVARRRALPEDGHRRHDAGAKRELG